MLTTSSAVPEAGDPSAPKRPSPEDWAMVEANMGLVHMHANRLPPHLREDAVQEGVFGLLRAAQKFDPNRGFKFSTYATWWIRQSMAAGVAAITTPVRIPGDEAINLRKVSAAINAAPGTVDDSTVADLSGVPAHRVQHLRQWIEPSTHLDASASLDGDATAGDMVIVHDGEHEAVEVRTVLDDVHRKDDLDRAIVAGWQVGHEANLRELGERFNMSRQAVHLRVSKLRALAREGGLVPGQCGSEVAA